MASLKRTVGVRHGNFLIIIHTRPNEHYFATYISMLLRLRNDTQTRDANK